MAYNEVLTRKIRLALNDFTEFEEKRMFRGVTFMVNGKLLVTCGDDEIMVRVAPDKHDEMIERFAGRSMIMKGREYRGYIYVQESLLSEQGLELLIAEALRFNAVLKKRGTKKSS